MNYRHVIAVIALAFGMGGCASYAPYGYSDQYYDDGSYYSPVDEGYGDYYYAPERRYYDYYDPFFYGPSFGSSYYGYGGYCSARYRYCPPFGYYDQSYGYPYGGYGFTLFLGGGGGWYDPYWSRHGYYSPYYGSGHGRRPRHHDDRTPNGAPGPSQPITSVQGDMGGPDRSFDAPRRDRVRPRPLDEQRAYQGPPAGWVDDDNARRPLDRADDRAMAERRRWRGDIPMRGPMPAGPGTANAPAGMPGRPAAPAPRPEPAAPVQRHERADSDDSGDSRREARRARQGDGRN